jgi:hypothetical protein
MLIEFRDFSRLPSREGIGGRGRLCGLAEEEVLSFARTM